MRSPWRRLRGAWWVAVFISTGAIAEPAGISVAPLRIDINEQTRSGALTVRNDTAQARRFQIELLRWTQDKVGDRYSQTDDLLANPPLFGLGIGAQQVLRVGVLVPPDADREQAYRVYVTELPDGNAAPAGQLNFRLRLGVPLFVAPKSAVRRAWQWSARHVGGEYVLRGENKGNVHQRRSLLKLSDADRGTPIGQYDGFRDVLADAASEWHFPAAAAPNARRLRITAVTDAGTDDSTITLGTP